MSERHHCRPISCFLFSVAAILLLIGGVGSVSAAEESPLEVVFDGDGLQELRFKGEDILESGVVQVRKIMSTDTYRHPARELDPTWLENPERGNPYDDEREFSEENVELQGSHFDRERHELHQEYKWGRVTVTYEPGPDGLRMMVEIENESERVIEVAEIELLQLRLPGDKLKARRVPGRTWWERGRNYHYIADTGANIGAPRILNLPFKGGRTVLYAPKPDRPISYRLPEREGGVFAAVVDMGDLPRPKREVYDREFNARPIAAGESDSFAVRLRFGSADANPLDMAEDVLTYFGEEKYPSLLSWSDRRPIGQAYLGLRGKNTEENPRAWRFTNKKPDELNVHTEEGRERVRKGLMDYADQLVANCRKMGVQGIVVWDIEGRAPGSGYVGSPRVLPYIAPAMDAAADDFFERLDEAGLRYGVTIRPTEVWPGGAAEGIGKVGRSNWRAHDADMERYEQYDGLHDPREARSALHRLHNEISYAKERWGATLFYIDAPGIWVPRDQSGDDPGSWESLELSPRLYRKLKELHPDVLLMPEDNVLSYWSATGVYSEVPGGSVMKTPATPDPVRRVYPEAFTVLKTKVRSWAALERKGLHHRFREGLIHGDVPMFHFWSPPFDGLKKIGHEAPWVVQLKDRQEAAITGPEFENEVKGEKLPLKIRHAFEEVDIADGTVPERRVRIAFRDPVSNTLIREVVDAVGKAGGLVVWSGPAGQKVEELQPIQARYSPEELRDYATTPEMLREDGAGFDCRKGRTVGVRAHRAALLVHGIECSENCSGRGFPPERTLAEFGYGLGGCEVHNYWDDNAPVSAKDDRVKWLLLERSGKLMVLVVTWNPDDAVVELSLDLDQLGVDVSRVVNAENEKFVSHLNEGTFSFEMDGHGVRAFRIE